VRKKVVLEGAGRGFGRPFVVVGWDHETGTKAGPVDLDFGDVGLDDRLALSCGAVFEHVDQAAP
jgi:hypothetical protein